MTTNQRNEGATAPSTHLRRIGIGLLTMMVFITPGFFGAAVGAAVFNNAAPRDKAAAVVISAGIPYLLFALFFVAYLIGAEHDRDRKR